MTLFASGDQQPELALSRCGRTLCGSANLGVDPIVAQTVSLQRVVDRAKEFDVLHFHIDWMLLPLLAHLRVLF
jgi:hypothetical protein